MAEVKDLRLVLLEMRIAIEEAQQTMRRYGREDTADALTELPKKAFELFEEFDRDYSLPDEED